MLEGVLPVSFIVAIANLAVAAQFTARPRQPGHISPCQVDLRLDSRMRQHMIRLPTASLFSVETPAAPVVRL